MHKTTFRNYHKQKYTLLRKIAVEITQWTTTHNTQKFRQMLGKTPIWGNPTRERERERDIIHLSGKYKTTTNTHFQPRKIPHNTKTVPINYASKNMPNPYCCTTSSVPHFPCPQSAVRIVSYVLETTKENLKSASKPMPKSSSISMSNQYRLYEIVRTVQTVRIHTV
jgi:hypothetical protein